LGVHLGNFDETIYEDKDLSYLLMFFHDAQRIEHIRTNNAFNKQWGFKFPSLHKHLFPKQLEHFRNPRLIVVMRDPVSIARRFTISDVDTLGNPKNAIAHATDEQHLLTRFINDSTYPVALVSYEKLLIFPRSIIAGIISFCGLKISEEKLNQAVLSIKANHEEYVEIFKGEA
jgi:hypothetical protein